MFADNCTVAENNQPTETIRKVSFRLPEDPCVIMLGLYEVSADYALMVYLYPAWTTQAGRRFNPHSLLNLIEQTIGAFSSNRPPMWTRRAKELVPAFIEALIGDPEAAKSVVELYKARRPRHSST